MLHTPTQHNTDHLIRQIIIIIVICLKKDISLAFLAQLLTPHVVSLQLVLHHTHAQRADFIMTHHPMKLRETAGDEGKSTKEEEVSVYQKDRRHVNVDVCV